MGDCYLKFADLAEERHNQLFPKITHPIQGLMLLKERLRGIKAISCLQEIENLER